MTRWPRLRPLLIISTAQSNTRATGGGLAVTSISRQQPLLRKTLRDALSALDNPHSRARHSVRAVRIECPNQRRARSDAPYLALHGEENHRLVSVVPFHVAV